MEQNPVEIVKLNNATLIASHQDRLRESLRSTLPATPGGYALLDFPDHSNVGDSAIWVGERALLQELYGCPPAYVCTVESFDEGELRASLPEGPIYLHGGGNFGDIWPKHQLFRERLMEVFKDRRLILLPQSIMFRDQSGVSRCAAAIKAHPDLRMFVRDKGSEAFARAHFDCPIGLLPDSALAMGPQARREAPSHELMLLLRTDKERVDLDFDAVRPRDSVVEDWLDEPRGFTKQTIESARLQAMLSFTYSKAKRRVRLYDRLAGERVERGLRQLGSARAVITDRLHAHILSLLLDVPHVALDNDYGKLSSYIAAWDSNYEALRTATTPDQAMAMLAELRS